MLHETFISPVVIILNASVTLSATMFNLPSVLLYTMFCKITPLLASQAAMVASISFCSKPLHIAREPTRIHVPQPCFSGALCRTQKRLERLQRLLAVLRQNHHCLFPAFMLVHTILCSAETFCSQLKQAIKDEPPAILTQAMRGIDKPIRDHVRQMLQVSTNEELDAAVLRHVRSSVLHLSVGPL